MPDEVVAGLDIGRRRIGIAVADAIGLAAHPIAVIERRSTDRDIERVRIAIADRPVTRIVVGLPLNMNDTEGQRAYLVREFATRLQHTLKISVELFDERLSTIEARERLGMGQARRKRQRQPVDAIAAAVILERWLTEQRGRLDG